MRELLGDLGSVLYSWLCKVLKVLSFPFVWIWKSLSSRVGLLRSSNTEASSENSEHSMGDITANEPTRKHDSEKFLDGQSEGLTNRQTDPTVGLASEETESFESEVSKNSGFFKSQN